MDLIAHRKAVIFVVTIIIIILGGALWIAQEQSDKPKTAPSPTPIAELIYEGVDVFIERGATSQHVADFKFAVHKYLKTTNQTVNKVQIHNVQHIHNSDNKAATDILKFRLTFDQQAPFEGRLEYNDFASARLVLIDPKTQQQVYDSGVIKVTGNE